MTKNKKVVVNYRLDPKTIEMLHELKKHDNPIYQGRTYTWLVERAISEEYKRAKQLNSNGTS